MELNDIIKYGGAVQIVVTVSDLKKAFEEWHQEILKSNVEDWLPTSEVIEKYSVSKQTLVNYEKKDKLHPVRRGVEKHFKLSELKEVFG